MYKRILVPTDGSDPSRYALVHALELAKKFNSEVELFHVTPTFEAYSVGVGYSLHLTPEQIKKAAEFVFETTLRDIDIENVPLSKKHASGYPASSIIDEIKREFDLVVMGTRGHGVIAGTILGSVTQRVLAHAQCPVLVVNGRN
ncbi:universal stress protein [Desulfosporosinus sp. OT]|uniref:universal stress protein n=1 Tax=Desulfosporosinus sp. OT TaxID=913865 RepID=UPI0002239BF0|nr:universal stress protein [Desulfosporosinus sp. OT]EGW36716.1 universal stress family protein [Desulfosporosinus sp. OT]